MAIYVMYGHIDEGQLSVLSNWLRYNKHIRGRTMVDNKILLQRAKQGFIECAEKA